MEYDVLKELIKFENSKEWIEFENYYKDMGINSQLGLFRYEDANTNFLKSVLEENNVYGYGLYPMKKFIELLMIKDTKLLDDINIFNYDISTIKISIRNSKICKSGIPDMIITFKINEEDYLILLEAKLQSGISRNSQCRDYYKDINENDEYSNYKKLFVYLTLTGGSSDDKEHYINITYQELIDYVYNPCAFKNSNSNITLTIEEYIKSFNSLYYEGIIEIKNLPLGYNAKQLTLNIWNKYKDNLFNKVLSAKDVDENFIQFYKSNGDVMKILFINIFNIFKEESNEIINKMESIANMTNKKNYIEDKRYLNTEFTYRVFEYLYNKGLIKNTDDIDKINECSKDIKYICTHEEYIKLQDNIKVWYSNSKYNKLVINDQEYFYLTSLISEEAYKLIDNVKKIFNNINIGRIENIEIFKEEK